VRYISALTIDLRQDLPFSPSLSGTLRSRQSLSSRRLSLSRCDLHRRHGRDDFDRLGWLIDLGCRPATSTI